MTDREDLYKSFGPKLQEAVCRVVLSEINILRSQAGLQERSLTQLLYAVESELDGLPDYDWMSD